jgi:hypothetical protein
MENKDHDLFNNPMAEAARNAMTPEQIEEYKKIGEYMFNNTDYTVVTTGSKVKNTNETDLVLYASEALKAGLDPFDLSEPELQALNSTYGEKWYLKFDLEPEVVPVLASQIVSAGDVYKPLSRQERRNEKRNEKKNLKRNMVNNS